MHHCLHAVSLLPSFFLLACPNCAPPAATLPAAPPLLTTTTAAANQILNLRAVSAWPAVLESTTLLLAQGTDLFFTRITPAAHFDSLPPDFSYGLLVVALLGLAGGTWFAAYSSSQALLKAKWQ